MVSGGRNLSGVNDCRSSYFQIRSTPSRLKGKPSLAQMKG